MVNAADALKAGAGPDHRYSDHVADLQTRPAGQLGIKFNQGGVKLV